MQAFLFLENESEIVFFFADEFCSWVMFFIHLDKCFIKSLQKGVVDFIYFLLVKVNRFKRIVLT